MKIYYITDKGTMVFITGNNLYLRINQLFILTVKDMKLKMNKH